MTSILIPVVTGVAQSYTLSLLLHLFSVGSLKNKTALMTGTNDTDL